MRIQPSRKKDQDYDTTLSRRRFLKLVPFTAFSCIYPSLAIGARPEEKSAKRSLVFYNTHTRETLCAEYWGNGKYRPDALGRINYILRDHRINKTQPMDTRLLDLLYDLSTQTNANRPFHVISGYRSPETNAMLHRQGRGVARKSYHMLGKAIDITIPGYRLTRLRDAAKGLKRGGVGFYPESGFIHVDTGPVRYW